jgi:hypothetical protein
MRGFRRVALLTAVLVALTGCTPVPDAELTELRQRFVDAGGTCDTSTAGPDSDARASMTCAEGAVLMVFNSTSDRADFIKHELETNRLIRERTHVIVSKDTWLVIDTLAVVVRVWPEMGGMISGRNGANP